MFCNPLSARNIIYRNIVRETMLLHSRAPAGRRGGVYVNREATRWMETNRRKRLERPMGQRNGGVSFARQTRCSLIATDCEGRTRVSVSNRASTPFRSIRGSVSRQKHRGRVKSMGSANYLRREKPSLLRTLHNSRQYFLSSSVPAHCNTYRPINFQFTIDVTVKRHGTFPFAFSCRLPPAITLGEFSPRRGGDIYATSSLS